MKRAISFVLAICMSFSLVATCAAASIGGKAVEASSEQEKPVVYLDDLFVAENENTRASSYPTEGKNLATADYTAKLFDLPPTKASFTQYYFITSTGYIHIDVDFIHSGTSEDLDRELTIEIYSKTSASAKGAKLNKTKVIRAGGEYTFTGLSTTDFYYFRFINTSSDNMNSGHDISANILISE